MVCFPLEQSGSVMARSEFLVRYFVSPAAARILSRGLHRSKNRGLQPKESCLSFLCSVTFPPQYTVPPILLLTIPILLFAFCCFPFPFPSPGGVPKGRGGFIPYDFFIFLFSFSIPPAAARILSRGLQPKKNTPPPAPQTIPH